ncbi:MAG: HEPN-associated N-terminal domain-containing protein [Acidimicrobiales bacterium]
MGSWKDRQIEQMEAGFSLDQPDRLVCPDCISDQALRLFVSRVALIGDDVCGFCGGPGPHGFELQELFIYMAGTIAAEWGDPYHQAAWDQEDQDYVAVGILDSDGLLAELGEPLAHEDLRAAFIAAFQHEWCQADPYRLSPSERLASNWERFSRYVKEESRYLFFRTGRSRAQHPDPDEIEPAAMLEQLGRAIVNVDLIRPWPGGSELFRARQHRLEETLKTPTLLGSPSRADAKYSNRMNPAGIPMFYGAEDPETALAELRLKAHNRRATVSRWTTARGLVYLDLVNVDVPSLFDSTGRPVTSPRTNAPPNRHVGRQPPQPV